jgi:hypothetical protein
MNASGVFRMSKKPAEDAAPSGEDGEATTMGGPGETTAASGPVSVEGGSRAREEDARATDEERDHKRTKTSDDASEDGDYEMSSDDGVDEDESDDDEDFKEATTRGRSAPVGNGAKIVDGKVVGRAGEEGADGGASAKVKVSATGSVRADRKSSDDPTPALLEALREYVAKCGGALSDDWTCTATMRTQGASAGSFDALYWSPEGDRYRSRLEVVRALGLAPQKILKSASVKKKPAHVEPISHEEAVKKSKEAERPTVPMELGENLVVVNLGQIPSPADEFHDDVHIWPLGYKTEWTNDSGIKFTSEVTKASDGAPEFIVSMEKEGDKVTTCAASPLGAWLEMCDAVGPTISIGIADHFAFEDVRVVRAIETLPGADSCAKYQYVEERGGWDDERVRRAKSRLFESKEILSQIRAVTKKDKSEKVAQNRLEKCVTKLIDRLISRVDTAATREKHRKERLEAKKALADQAKKHRDSLKEAAKAEKEAARAAAKMQKEAQKEADKIAKEAAKAKAAVEREAQKEINKARRAKEAEEKKKRDAEHAQRMAEIDKKQKVWLTGMEERESDSADTSYSPPVMTPNLKIEPEFTEHSEMADLMEIWMFLDRFKRELFGAEADFKSPPTVQALARALTNPKEFEEILSALHLALISPCIADAAASTDKSSSSALKLLPDEKSHSSETRGVWQEVVRRFLYASSIIYDMPTYEPFLKDAPPILPEAADVFTRHMCTGNAGFDPISYEEGAPWMGHAVEKYSARVAPTLCASVDAESLAAAEIELYTFGSGATDDLTSRVVESRRQKACAAVKDTQSSQTITAVRGALRNMACMHSMNQVCRRGDAAAVKGQCPRGLDLRLFDARLEAGVYAAAAHSTNVDNEMHDLIRADAAEVAETVSSLTNGNGPKAKRELIAAIDAALKQTKATTDDLPKTPWDEGCAVCGLDVVAGTVLLCDSCDAEYHTKCLDPPLSAEPEGEWFCPKCVRKSEDKNPPNVLACKSFQGTKLEKASTGETIAVKDAIAEEVDDDDDGTVCAGGCRGSLARRLRSLSRALQSMGFEGLTTQTRVTLMRTLMTLALDSVALRTSLDNGVNLANEVKKDIRNHIKAWSEYRLDREDGKGEARDAEEAEAAEQAKAAEPAKDEPDQMDVDGANDADKEKKVVKSEEEKKEKKAKTSQAKQKIPTEEEIAQARVRWQSKWHEVEKPLLCTAPRLSALGTDRHEQKYWAVGNWGEVIVQAAKGDDHRVEPSYGILTLEDAKALIGKINPKGRREGDLWRSLQRRFGADPEAFKEVNPVPERPDDSEWGKSESSGDGEGLARVRATFLTLENEIPDVAFNKTLGSESRRTMCRNLAASAQTLPSLAAAIIVFERAIESDWLQPGWLSWSWISPLLRCAQGNPAEETSHARSLRLHLIALRRAFKWNKATRVSERLINAEPDVELPRSARTRRKPVIESESGSDDEYDSIFSDSEEVIPKNTARDRKFRL